MARHDEGFFSAKDNLRLFWQVDIPDAPKAHIGVVHGFMDHCGRYRGVIDALVKDGFAVHAFDYRGHGQADGRRSHVDHWPEYLDDLDLFWAKVTKAAQGAKAFLLSHSHGGLMAIHWYQRKPQGLSGMIFSAPWLANTNKPPALKVLAGKAVGSVIPWIPFKNPLKPEELTRDPEMQKAVIKDPLYNQVLTPGWYNQAVHFQDEAKKLGSTITVPVFVFNGQKDPVASPEVVRGFFESVGAADKKYKEYPDRVHECMNDLGREEVWRDISNWISAHV